VLACQGGELLREVGGQMRLQLAVGHGFAGVRRGCADGQRRGCGEALEGAAPIRFGLGHVLPPQPDDVVAERPRRGQVQVLAATERVVVGEDLAQQQRDGPAVQQDVVVGPDELVGVVGQPQQGQADEGRLGQVEAPSLLRREEGGQPALLLGRVQPAPVLLCDSHIDLAAHDLDGFLQPLPGERGAQDGMALHHALPGALERGDVQPAAQGSIELLHVDAGLRREQAVKEHALLHRRERVKAFDVLGGRCVGLRCCCGL